MTIEFEKVQAVIEDIVYNEWQHACAYNEDYPCPHYMADGDCETDGNCDWEDFTRWLLEEAERKKRK